MRLRATAISVFAALITLSTLTHAAAPATPADIRPLIQQFKQDSRGPYQGIRWFYPDGTVHPAQAANPNGWQHGLIKDVVKEIQIAHGVYLGQILAGLPNEAFWDAKNQHSRAKQYQLEAFLQRVDDGWIARKSRYYRGAIQQENEHDWGAAFLRWVLEDNDNLTMRFYLVRQLAADLPHRGNDSTLRNARAQARVIGNAMPSFVDLRVKVHGKLEQKDLAAVRAFRKANQEKIGEDLAKTFDELEASLTRVFQEASIVSLSKYLPDIPAASNVDPMLKKLIESGDRSTPAVVCADIAGLLWEVRLTLPTLRTPKSRLGMLDLSLDLEAVLLRKSNEWKPKSAGELLKKSHVLAKAMAGCGHLERWEWERLAPLYAQTTTGAVPLDDFVQQVTNARRAVDWGVGTVRAVYEPTINLFLPFEPLAAGLLDDIVRSSVLLPAGDVVGELFDVSAKSSGVTARVMGIRRQSDIYGLNPGFAVGELEVVTGAPEEIEFSPNKIYALLRAPEDMKPVAGLMTVSEGNTVSHVQLLARNLGIPNAVLSPESINELVSHNGKAVFYAVSPRGSVVMKPSSEMSADEMKLIDAQQRNEERITVPTDHLNLKRLEVISVADLRATDSGKLVGPKAANLGQLKSQFPNRVSSGLAIPFGIFRQHLDQPMPGSDGTYWAFLQATFTKATADRKAGKSDAEIDAYVLARLTTLRDAIKKMTLRPDFSADLKTRFKEVFGGEFGRVAVFVRSDTNMEDLKDFTGAGLNLTVPNVRDAEKLLQAVRDVWASPYTERSYRWRQKYLLNPENVYPSVLLQESINGDKSGVMITTGVASGNPLDTTIAFNRGVGGAVAGQSTESYALAADGSNVLQASSRDAIFTALSKDGGTSRVPTTFHQPILSTSDLAALRAIDGEIRQKLPGAPGIETDGPFDVELGLLNGWVWLFQVRPFVENKAAQSNVFLRDLDPPLAANATVDLSRAL